MGFMDLRQWLAMLEKESSLRRIAAFVDWDREIGAIARRVLEKKGPALRIANTRPLGRRGRPVRGLRPRDIIAYTRTPAAPGADGTAALVSSGDCIELQPFRWLNLRDFPYYFGHGLSGKVLV